MMAKAASGASTGSTDDGVASRQKRVGVCFTLQSGISLLILFYSCLAIEAYEHRLKHLLLSTVIIVIALLTSLSLIRLRSTLTSLHTNISVWINRRFVSSISSESTKVASIVGKQRCMTTPWRLNHSFISWL
ncbi:hypothetical protein L1987_39040 [Smallanthus sonchifolius]|uniref:Uncharacterized protein n=1 Tax=Smallanthus sonchifolius TaxID=185202 RepID=A0ACB9HMP5_9ASTR|nr:hypothetical protein L1987_39040 [Smallanthus sonchifolius]